MSYLRSLFLNFLIVFFADRTIPGIQVVNYEGVPDVIADVLFAFFVGLLNSSIYPVFYVLGIKVTTIRLAICALIVSFGSFYLLMHMQIGVVAFNYTGVFFAGALVSAMSLFTNVLEKKYFHFND